MDDPPGHLGQRDRYGLTATAIYWIAPDNERSMMGAFIGGLLTAGVAAGALIAMSIAAFGS